MEHGKTSIKRLYFNKNLQLLHQLTKNDYYYCDQLLQINMNALETGDEQI